MQVIFRRWTICETICEDNENFMKESADGQSRESAITTGEQGQEPITEEK